jgi:hypothetical protein
MKYKLFGLFSPFVLPVVLSSFFYIGVGDAGLSLYVLIICISFLNPLIQLVAYLNYRKQNYPYSDLAIGLKYSLFIVTAILVIALFNQDVWLI